jgi:hypothetical protein
MRSVLGFSNADPRMTAMRNRNLTAQLQVFLQHVYL